jgi:hypothetical protein
MYQGNQTYFFFYYYGVLCAVISHKNGLNTVPVVENLTGTAFRGVLGPIHPWLGENNLLYVILVMWNRHTDVHVY